ncbi:MAG: dienelactone hydrolase family protein [Chloroflexi bacterium]|nr:dienelactone hydrolase family protein [Chloroflexota bacterium]
MGFRKIFVSIVTVSVLPILTACFNAPSTTTLVPGPTSPVSQPPPASPQPPVTSSPYPLTPLPSPTAAPSIISTPTAPVPPPPDNRLTPVPPVTVTPAILPASGAGWRQTKSPPNGFEQKNVQWIEIDTSSNYKLVAAVFRPEGTGPFPVIVLLHASAGFTGPFTKGIGNHFVQNGFLVVGGLWFSGHAQGWEAPGLIDWPQGPPFAGTTDEAIKYANIIVQTARLLPGADGKHMGVFGTSRGAMASVLLASTGAGVQAVVADSASYSPKSPIDKPAIGLVQNMEAPLLMLHGTADQTAPVQSARDYEAALKRLNKPYEARYYEGGAHVVTVPSSPNRADALATTVSFLKKYLMQ